MAEQLKLNPMTGEFDLVGQADSDTLSTPITGFVSGAGVVTSTDTILQAINKLDGNIAASGSGTVTSVSVVTANGVSGSVATESTTPAITLSLGAITPSSVNSLTLLALTTGFSISGGTTSKTLTVSDTASVSGTNTGDQSLVSLGAEATANKVTSISSGSTDTQYPSAKLLYDQLAGKQPTGSYLTSVVVDSPLSGSGTSGSHLTVDLSGRQPLNANLTSISGMATTTGFVKQTSENTFGIDTSTYLTSYTETDPVVKAINGIVKSNGTTISSATADTDYASPTLARQLGVDINRYGFLNRTETTLSFDGTDTITLASVGANWSYYRAGIKYTITGNKTKQLASPMVDGTFYFIYIDAVDGTLSSSTSSWTLQDTKVPVATVYWDSRLTPKYVKCDERHTVGIDRSWHREHHFVEGTQAAVFGTVTGLTAGSDTPSTKTFGISGTVVYDEDLKFTLADFTDPDGATAVYPILYRTSATTYSWILSDMPFKYTTSAGPVYGYGEYDLNGTSTQAGANQFFNTYIYASTAVAGTEANPEISTSSMRYFIMQGRGVYSTSALALAESFLVSAGMPTAEGVCLYQLTWATTNRPDTVKGRCRFVSIQQVKANNITTSVITATSHNGLSGLDGGTAGEYYHLTSAEYTATASTGSGAMARLVSPVFTTPNIGSATGSISGNAATSTTAPTTAVLISQATPQTVGSTSERLLKLWATDITCTNAITGSVTGNAGTVTNGIYTTSQVTALAAADTGDKGKYLKANTSTGVLEWATISAGFTDPMTTRGDIIVRKVGGTDRLALGTSGQVLVSDGTDISWGSASTGLFDIDVNGDLEPITDTLSDDYYELDVNDDLQPKA